MIDALDEFPLCNATVSGEEITTHDAVHLGVAVDLDHVDLVVPVVHDAHTLRLRALSSRIGELALNACVSGACDRTTSPAGTFTITNPGPFGTIVSAPVLNIPQVAILATDAVRPRLVVVPGADGTDTIAVHPVGVLALGFDGRVPRPQRPRRRSSRTSVTCSNSATGRPSCDNVSPAARTGRPRRAGTSTRSTTSC